jgi:hypothetical protein
MHRISDAEVLSYNYRRGGPIAREHFSAWLVAWHGSAARMGSFGPIARDENKLRLSLALQAPARLHRAVAWSRLDQIAQTQCDVDWCNSGKKMVVLLTD